MSPQIYQLDLSLIIFDQKQISAYTIDSKEKVQKIVADDGLVSLD